MLDQLVIFAKYPDPGRVKTRLAASVGPEAAAAVYTRFVERILSAMTQPRVASRIVVAVSDPAAVRRFQQRFPGADAYLGQLQTDDLGERMLAVFQQAEAQGYNKTVIIGTDSPTLPPDLVRQAFAQLDQHEVVLGPAEDGGYYLIGAKRPHEGLFRNISWSTPDVLSQTVAALQRLGIRYAQLPVFYDVDELADLQRLYEQAPDLLSGFETWITTEAST